MRVSASSAESPSLESALTQLRAIVDAGIGVVSSPDVYSKAAQLKAVQKTLTELARKGVSVPQELQHLEAELLSYAVTVEEANTTLKYVRSQLREMLKLVSKRSDSRKMGKKRRSSDSAPRTAVAQLEDVIVECLREHGGAGSPSEILTWIQDRMVGRFLPGDLVKVRNGPAWRSAVRGLRGPMIRAGILRGDSRRGVWQLE